MVRKSSRLAAISAAAAAFSLAATPAAAHGDRWGRHRDGVSAGDVLAGVLIIGGIAAIASAASKSNRDREVRDTRYREPYPQDRYDYRPEYRESRPEPGSYQGSGIDNAVNMCVDQVERGDTRVGSVDNASRRADGWRISGQLDAGGGFSCWIDNDGRIRDVNLGGDYHGASSVPSGDAQWDDDAYARARAQASSADQDAIDGDLEGQLGG